MSDIFKIANLKSSVASLRGANVRPMNPGTFCGYILVPKKYFTEWRTPLEAALAFLDDDDWESAVMEGARGVTIQ